MKSEKEAFADRMLHIILLILKIIGIILLCILGILLLAVLCALFVPVRYRIRVSRKEGEGNPPVTACVRVTWLLHLVNILVRYPAEIIVRVRILFVTIFRMPAKEGKSGNSEGDKRKRKRKRQSGQDEESAQEPETNPGSEEAADGSTGAEEWENAKDSRNAGEGTAADSSLTHSGPGKPEDAPPQDPGADEAQDDGGTKSAPVHMIRRFLDKIKELIEKIKQTVDKIKAFFENIQYTIRKFCDKIKSALHNIQYYREVLESDSFKRSLELCKGELGYVFRKLKPDQFEADLNVSMEDPAALGQILAIYGMFYPWIGQHVRLVGDFEREGTYIEGGMYIRGKIRAVTFLRVLIRVYRNKDIRRLIKLLKKEAV